MKDKIEQLMQEVASFQTTNEVELENFRIKFLSRKGILQELFSEFKSVPSEQKKCVGQQLNELKLQIQGKIDSIKAVSVSKPLSDKNNVDITLPGEPIQIGTRHPISITKNKIIEIFSHIGFTVSNGPEIEDDWHNFSALNFPEEHPARDMQDTFFIEKGKSDFSRQSEIALRTHTSSVQVRVMESTPPPIRTISPGRVFRNEAISARSHCIFHQVEGLYIDKNVSFADLKQTLLYFTKEMFGDKTQIRLRPSFFPFTEPSAEMDISCFLCGGKGCNICKYSGWVEILGCGMVDPNVLNNCNIDNQKYTGFAFGMGIERIAMLKYKVQDIRLFFENDVRFIEQFKHF